MTAEKVKEAFSCTPFNSAPGPTCEHRLIIENLKSVKVTQDKMATELEPLKNRQDLVSLHHKVLKETNLLIETDGRLDAKKFEQIITELKNDLDVKLSNEIKPLDAVNDAQKIDRLKEKYRIHQEFLDDTLKSGNDIRKDTEFYTKEQRDRLVDNIRMNMDDLNVQNDMQLQKVSRLNNESYESYQNARLMLKTLHDTFMTLIKNWR